MKNPHSNLVELSEFDLKYFQKATSLSIKETLRSGHFRSQELRQLDAALIHLNKQIQAYNNVVKSSSRSTDPQEILDDNILLGAQLGHVKFACEAMEPQHDRAKTELSSRSYGNDKVDEADYYLRNFVQNSAQAIDTERGKLIQTYQALVPRDLTAWEQQKVTPLPMRQYVQPQQNVAYPTPDPAHPGHSETRLNYSIETSSGSQSSPWDA